MRELLVATTAVAVLSTGSALAANSAKHLGKVQFETSCTPAAQKLFNQGMLYQHSFWYRSSKQTFEDVLKADPELRHGVLGHCVEPALQSACATAAGKPPART